MTKVTEEASHVMRTDLIRNLRKKLNLDENRPPWTRSLTFVPILATIIAGVKDECSAIFDKMIPRTPG